jgi:membrane protein DedA with SNARE-associated domain
MSQKEELDVKKKRTIKQKKRGVLFLQIGVFLLVYLFILLFLRDKFTDIAKITSIAGQVYGTYGYYLIFLGALVEGIFILGFYIPGSLIVLLGVSLARLGILSFPLVVIFGISGFCLAYCFNYYLGRVGWYKIVEGFGFEKQIDGAKKKLVSHYSAAFFWGYIMPSTGSVLSTASGILRVPFKAFIFRTLLIQSFWSLFIGSLAYIFGLNFINVFLVYFGIIVFLSLMLYLLNKVLKKKRR